MNERNSRNHRKRKRASRAKRQTKLLLIMIVVVLIIVAAISAFLIISNSKPKDPENLSITSDTSSQTLSWDKGKKNSDFVIYRKNPAQDDQYEEIAAINAYENTSYTISDLSSATFYEYKVTNRKNDKETEGKSISAFTIPLTVHDCSAATKSKESLTVFWKDEQSVAGYEIKYADKAAPDNEITSKLSVADISYNETDQTYSYTVENLPEGNTYKFSIRGFCDETSFSKWCDGFEAKVTRAVDLTGIDITRPMVALTFDDGPEYSDITNRILDAFASVGGHGTFFQLGNRCEDLPDQIQRIANEGHEVGCHTYDHIHMGEAVNSNDIVSANDAIENACGIRPTAFRSPGGATTETIREVCRSEDMPIYYWSVDTRDWATRDCASIVSEVQANTFDGAIILMHNLYSSTADACEQVIPWLVSQGYQLVTVSQLVQAKTGNPPIAGVQYFTAFET